MKKSKVNYPKLFFVVFFVVAIVQTPILSGKDEFISVTFSNNVTEREKTLLRLGGESSSELESLIFYAVNQDSSYWIPTLEWNQGEHCMDYCSWRAVLDLTDNSESYYFILVEGTFINGDKANAWFEVTDWDPNCPSDNCSGN